MLPKELSYEMLELFIDYRNLSIFQSKGLLPVTPENLGDVNVRLSRNRHLSKYHGITLDIDSGGFKTIFGHEITYHEPTHEYRIAKEGENFHYDADTGLLKTYTQDGEAFKVIRINRQGEEHAFPQERIVGEQACQFDKHRRLAAFRVNGHRVEITYVTMHGFDIREERHHFPHTSYSLAWSAIKPSSVVAMLKEDDGKVTVTDLHLKGKL